MSSRTAAATPCSSCRKAVNSVDRTDTMRRARILRWASLSAALAACAAGLLGAPLFLFGLHLIALAKIAENTEKSP